MKFQLRHEVEEHSQISNKELRLFHYGYEECCENTYWGPGVKDHYKIHLVISGKGTYKYRDTSFEINQGMAFLTEPNTLTEYRADSEMPWSYVWIAFDGEKVPIILEQTGFSVTYPVMSIGKKVLNEINIQCQSLLRMDKRNSEKELLEMSFLYKLLSCFIQSSVKTEAEKGVKDSYVEQARQYVKANYSRQISCSSIADHIGIHRKYLTKIFREIINETPQHYLIDFRIQRAKKYLDETSLTVSEVANSVGYLDPLTFSKTFKRVTGDSPTEYRKVSRLLDSK